jgi:uncharacterized protein YqeY
VPDPDQLDPAFVVAFMQRLRDDLLAARKARDRARVSVLRTTLAAIENAEAPIATGPSWPPQVGLSTDHDRLVLSEAVVRSIVEREIDERVHAADELAPLGQDERAHELRTEAEILRPYLAEPSG